MSVYVEAGIIGLPDGVKEGGRRVDFKPNDFDLLIETKTPRFGWARASLCPCSGFNNQTDQPDPQCPVCKGVGWLHFRPQSYCFDEDKAGVFDTAQKALLDKYSAVPIRALMTGASKQADIFTALGKWAFGSSLVTVRPENKLGYYDKLIGLDEEMIFSEVIALTAAHVASGRVTTRYPIVGLNLARSLATEYGCDDFTLESGELVWKTGRIPAVGTRITLHYLCRPVWVVLEHVKLNRTSMRKFKRPAEELTQPAGEVLRLPVQSLVRLEHLPSAD